ncbi:MAG: ubiquitin-conjugating enzyme E2 [archaeon]|nr:ubiquitin-conjugating enzyme E2 [archaeon]
MIGLRKKKEMKEEVDTEKETYSAGKIAFQKEIKEVREINKEIPQAKYSPGDNPSNIMQFYVTYTPEKDSIWFGGQYKFSFTVDEKFPFNPPKVMCLTKIYHPNIDFQGNVCLNILKDDWRPTLTIATCIAGVYYLFTDPNPNDPLNHEAANVMRDNINQFKENVKRSLRGGYCFGQEFQRFTSGYYY